MRYRFYLVIPIIFLCSCTAWNRERVQTLNGKNRLIVKSDDECKAIRESFDKLINDSLDVSNSILIAIKSCSLNGPNDSVYASQKDKFMDFLNNNYKPYYNNYFRGTTAKERKKKQEFFDSCFHSISASNFVYDVVMEVPAHMGTCFGLCSEDFKKIFKTAHLLEHT